MLLLKEQVVAVKHCFYSLDIFKKYKIIEYLTQRKFLRKVWEVATNSITVTSPLTSFKVYVVAVSHCYYSLEIFKKYKIIYTSSTRNSCSRCMLQQSAAAPWTSFQTKSSKIA